MKCLTKIIKAIEKALADGKRPKCILMRPSFYEEVEREITIASIMLKYPNEEPKPPYFIFGIRMVRTEDIDTNVRLFEVIV